MAKSLSKEVHRTIKNGARNDARKGKTGSSPVDFFDRIGGVLSERKARENRAVENTYNNTYNAEKEAQKMRNKMKR